MFTLSIAESFGNQIAVYYNLNSINENPKLYALLPKNKNVVFKNSSVMPIANEAHSS